jgi:hypothetical protein
MRELLEKEDKSNILQFFNIFDQNYSAINEFLKIKENAYYIRSIPRSLNKKYYKIFHLRAQYLPDYSLSYLDNYYIFKKKKNISPKQLKDIRKKQAFWYSHLYNLDSQLEKVDNISDLVMPLFVKNNITQKTYFDYNPELFYSLNKDIKNIINNANEDINFFETGLILESYSDYLKNVVSKGIL